MPQPVNTQQAIQDAAQAFEDYATRVSYLVGARALAWQSIARDAAAIGLDPAQVAPALANANAQATAEAAQWQSWVNDLAAGRAELVPYQVGNEPIKLGVRPVRGGEMGFWPIVSTIWTVGSRAALAVGSWLSLDAWQDTRQTEATARLTDAETRRALIDVARTDPRVASQVAAAMNRADQVAADAGPDWIDRLTTGATAAAGGLSSGLLLFLAWWWFTQRKGRK